MAKRKIKPTDVTHDEFVFALTEIVDEMSADELLAIPGIYEALSEHLNNEAIKRAVERMEDDR
jgi:hypothetical protein